MDWTQAAAVAATATLLSLLTSVASAGVGNPGPSLASEEVVAAPEFPDGEGI